MKTALPVVGPAIDYELLLDCVHCGLCTAACPTYVETGNEAASPRGRIYLMRQVIDGALDADATVKGHLDTCLNCRACETACPSGVQYGKLIEPFREHLERLEPGRSVAPLNRLQRFLLFHVFPSRHRTRAALAPARLLQWSGADYLLEKSGLIGLLPPSLRTMKRMLPPLAPHYGRLPAVLPPVGPRRARVGLFLGCVADAIYPRTTFATAKVVQANGCEVVIPPSQVCCGALHHHSGDPDTAHKLAAANVAAFPADLDAVISNAAGCGFALKGYEPPFADKVRDISEFLADLGLVKPTHPVNLSATYHDACHLRHGQKVQTAPRQLLAQVPGLTVVPLPESELCCGAAGSYNLTQPEMAGKLGDRKVSHVVGTGAHAVLTGNVGCLMQISRHLKAAGSRVWAGHPVDLLWAAYGGRPVA
jgi:glycolate oxidase iron-sulfur subunit